MILSSDKPVLDRGDPANDTNSYRRCLGQFGTGVAVITACTPEQGISAMTVNSFSSVSLSPPLILWSLRTNSGSADAFLNTPRFAVNVLASDQIEVARHYASSRRDRSADRAMLVEGSCPPRLKGVVAHMECAFETRHDAGDHYIIIGRVERFTSYSAEPLLFVQGQYGIPADHPDRISPPAAPAPLTSAAPARRDLTALIFDARNVLAARFERHRNAEGISPGQARVLRRVDESPGIDRQGLLEATFLGDREFDDAVESLIGLSLLEMRQRDGFVLTRKGLERRQAIRQRWWAFQSAQTAGIPKEDLDTAIEILERLIARDDTGGTGD